MNGGDLVSLSAGTAVVFAALLFARALVHKLTDFTAFTGFLADYGVIPERFVTPASTMVLVAEAGVVALLLYPPTWSIGAALAALLLLGYGAAIASAVRSGRRWVECGCGGAVQPVSWALVLRNAILAAIAALGTLGHSSALSLGETIAVLAAGFAVFVGYILVEQILGNAAHAASRA
ncbi:MauE/DoxX family redox-associated membrane protein [Chthonobacter albigriseus]|uniref:MauE/DoxX family redox-associated membrane protein n=1 Tax=Chthonobacter albigriseus TaxID=1683161 RepID=UPI0015EF49A9|nr:MauE/DoxX family redox-associated membrane protein [Chthonobacter albigriseus]